MPDRENHFSRRKYLFGRNRRIWNFALTAYICGPGEVRTEAIVENNTEEIVQAAIDTTAAATEATGAGSAEVALTTFPKLC